MALPAGRPAAGVARRGGPQAGLRPAGRPPAPGVRRRGPAPDRGPRPGRRGPGLPPPGGRLRRVVRRVQRRRHPGQAQGHPPDGGGPDLRGRRPGGEGGPDRRPVRQAPRRPPPSGWATGRPGLVPGPHGQRRPARGLGPGARPGPAGHRLPAVGLHPQPAPGLHQGRVRRPRPGPRLEPAVRGRVERGAPVRGHRRGDRPGAAVHVGLRHQPDRPRTRSTRSTSGPATRRSSSTTRRP